MKYLITIIVILFVGCSTYIVFAPTFKRTVNINKDSIQTIKENNNIINKKRKQWHYHSQH